MRLSRAAPAALVVLALAATAACGDEADGGGPGDDRQDRDLTVFAAASLTDAFEEIGHAFEAATPDTSVRLSFAGSSELVAQIEQGAPADVFASADEPNMARLVDAEGSAGQPVVFATNRLQIVTEPGNPAGITGVADLARPDLVVVTCAPQVPCGTYAQEVFSNAGVTVTPKSHEENVRAVANKVRLGEADAGIVYATDVAAAGDQATGVEIPDDINVVAEYPIVVTTEAANRRAADAFIAFVLGDEAQSILARHGFTPPAAAT